MEGTEFRGASNQKEHLPFSQAFPRKRLLQADTMPLEGIPNLLQVVMDNAPLSGPSFLLSIEAIALLHEMRDFQTLKDMLIKSDLSDNLRLLICQILVSERVLLDVVPTMLREIAERNAGNLGKKSRRETRWAPDIISDSYLAPQVRELEKQQTHYEQLLQTELKDKQGKWVAICRNQIIAENDDKEKAIDEAVTKAKDDVFYFVQVGMPITETNIDEVHGTFKDDTPDLSPYIGAAVSPPMTAQSKEIEFKLDTGSSFTAFTHDTFKEVGLKITGKTIIGRAFGGTEERPTSFADVSLDARTNRVEAIVGLNRDLLGMDVLKNYKTCIDKRKEVLISLAP